MFPEIPNEIAVLPKIKLPMTSSFLVTEKHSHLKMYVLSEAWRTKSHWSTVPRKGLSCCCACVRAASMRGVGQLGIFPVSPFGSTLAHCVLTLWHFLTVRLEVFTLQNLAGFFTLQYLPQQFHKWNRKNVYDIHK